jgi:hypothetical protein
MNPEAEILAAVSDDDRIYCMAKEWLQSKGEDVDTIIEQKEREDRGELFIEKVSGLKFGAEFGWFGTLNCHFPCHDTRDAQVLPVSAGNLTMSPDQSSVLTLSSNGARQYGPCVRVPGREVWNGGN